MSMVTSKRGTSVSDSLSRGGKQAREKPPEIRSSELAGLFFFAAFRNFFKLFFFIRKKKR